MLFFKDIVLVIQRTFIRSHPVHTTSMHFCGPQNEENIFSLIPLCSVPMTYVYDDSVCNVWNFSPTFHAIQSSLFGKLYSLCAA